MCIRDVSEEISDDLCIFLEVVMLIILLNDVNAMNQYNVEYS